jgi:Endonuclease/Exonuclease/phosphatase family 2
VGSWNLNGKAPTESLAPWLFPEGSTLDPDIIAVGFQEIVELTAQQIMSTDPAKRLVPEFPSDSRKLWEVQVLKTLNQVRPKGEYILLRSGQLVGTALLLFVKSSKFPYIKRVDGSVKKVPHLSHVTNETGLKGMAGNKGAIAIRLDYGTTSICFVTAHLAAGHANIEQRNMDYHTIDKGVQFPRGRSVADHDLIFWAGDSNYRINLPNEEVRRLIDERQWSTLYENDQLHLGMLAGDTFLFYREGQIQFPPTYKFDNGTDEYDSSEKQRIPAWTDRILFRGTGLKLLDYSSATHLKMSDHRPVYATFTVQCRIVEESKREQLAREIYSRRKAMVGDFLIGDIEKHVDSNGKRNS